MILKDTSRFQEVWYNFVKTGSYCNYTKDSYAYKEFWLREDDRCRNGLKLNDLYIPGTYYFYLNYYPILAKDEKTGRKKQIAPRFTDVDLEYFTIIEKARKEKKGVILAKPRRTGFSFKNSCLIVHEYNFYRDAKCVIGAYLSDLSTNTMSMCLDGLNWLDKYTEWKKQRNPDTRTFVKARYKETIDGIDIWKGFNSQIEVVTFKDNPFASIGKCMAKGTKVLMYDGSFKNIEDVVVGDKLMGPDSKERNVLSTTIGKDWMYEIQQERGISYTVNSEHNLYLEQRCNSNAVKDDGIKILTPLEFLKLPKYKQLYTTGIKANQINFKSSEILIDPYYLGLWLGDGNSCGPAITIGDKENELLEYLEKFYSSFKEHNIKIYRKNNSNCSTIRLTKSTCNNELHNLLKYYKLINNKHIPKEYLINSIDVRLQILAGLIDSDGYKINDTYYEIIQKNKVLADNIVFLTRSLGFYTKISEKKSTIKGKDCGIVYRIMFTGDFSKIPVKVKRKKCKHKNTRTNPLRTRIKVEKKYYGDYYGFELDGDHLYLLEDFTITHNTTNIFIFEEGGKFPNLIESYNISEPCWRDGEDMIGIPIIYGTGGDMEGGTVEFAEMFYNPEKFNLLAFDNIWDDDKSGSKCGWFIPANRMRFGKFEYEGKTVDLVDVDGNSNVEAATASIMKLRELKSKSGVDKDYRDTITQFPLKPAEAFLRSGYNKFPVAELQQVLGKIESTKSYEYDEKYVELFFNEKAPRGVDYNILHNAKPLVDYPVKEVQREGCIVVYEFPIELPDGTTPPELYMIAHDPTKNDDEGNSLAGIQVFKTHRYFNLYGHDEVVAEFYGRRGKDEINEILEKLAMWYGLSNKMLFFENAVGNTKEYFERKKKLHYLCTQPQTIFNKKAAFTSTGNIIYGYPMSNQYIKAEAEDYLKEWLLEDRNKEGNLKNLHLLKSRMLLKQLIAYNRDGNFDAVMTAVGWASGRRERFNIYEKEKERENKTNKLDFLINNKKVFNNGSKSVRVRS